MKILHIIAQLPARTGSGVYFSNLIREFKKHGENYAIYGFDESIGYPFTELNEENCYPVHFKSDKLNFPIVGMSDVMPYDNTRYKDMTEEMVKNWKRAFQEQILKAFDEIDPDIIVCHHLWMLTSLVLDLLGDRGKKIVGICHGTDIRQCVQNERMKEKYVHDLNRLDLAFALSKKQIDEIAQTYGIDKDKIHYTGGGYNQELFYRDDEYKYEEHNSFINIVFAGKIDNSKGVYEMIEAFKSLNYGCDVILNVIGTPVGENIDRIHKTIKGTKNIKLFNAKHQVELADMFRYSDIFILPSYYEGLGLVAIEALASGCFIVSSELKPLMEVLGEKVNNSKAIEFCPLPKLKNLDTPVEEEIPTYVNNLAKSIDIQVQRAKNGEKIPDEIFEEVKAHSWEKIADRMFEFINSTR